MAILNRVWGVRSIRDSWFEGLLFLPAALIVSKLILTGVLLWVWVFSLFVIRALGVIVMKWLERRIWLVLVGIVAAFITPILFPIPLSAAVVLTAVGAVSFWRSVHITTAKEYLYPAALYVVGLVSYVAYAALAARYRIYRPTLSIVTLLAVVCIVFILLEINRMALGDASFTQTETIDVDNKVKQINRLHVVALIVVAQLFGAFSKACPTSFVSGRSSAKRGYTSSGGSHRPRCHLLRRHIRRHLATFCRWFLRLLAF